MSSNWTSLPKPILLHLVALQDQLQYNYLLILKMQRLVSHLIRLRHVSCPWAMSQKNAPSHPPSAVSAIRTKGKVEKAFHCNACLSIPTSQWRDITRLMLDLLREFPSNWPCNQSPRVSSWIGLASSPIDTTPCNRIVVIKRRGCWKGHLAKIHAAVLLKFLKENHQLPFIHSRNFLIGHLCTVVSETKAQ